LFFNALMPRTGARSLRALVSALGFTLSVVLFFFWSSSLSLMV